MAQLSIDGVNTVEKDAPIDEVKKSAVRCPNSTLKKDPPMKQGQKKEVDVD